MLIIDTVIVHHVMNELAELCHWLQQMKPYTVEHVSLSLTHPTGSHQNRCGLGTEQQDTAGCAGQSQNVALFHQTDGAGSSRPLSVNELGVRSWT